MGECELHHALFLLHFSNSRYYKNYNTVKRKELSPNGLVTQVNHSDQTHLGLYKYSKNNCTLYNQKPL